MPATEHQPTPSEELLRSVKARGEHLRLRRKISALCACIAVLAATATVSAVALRPDERTALVTAAEGGRQAVDEERPASEEDLVGESGGPVSGESRAAAADAISSDRPPAAAPTSTTVGRSGGSTTTAISGASPSGKTKATTAASSEPFPAPRAGVYRYRVTNGAEQGSEERRTYEVVRRDEREVQLHQRSSATPDAEEPVDIFWRRDRVIVSDAASCDQMEDLRPIRYMFPLVVGNSWSNDNTCTSDKVGQIRRRMTARVTEQARVTVSGRSFEAWTITTTGQVDVTLRGVTQSNFFTQTEVFVPELGLPVRITSSVRQTEAETSPGRPPIERQLLHTDPE